MNVKGTTLALRSLLGLPHHIASAYFCILFICFVLFFSCWWSKLKPKTLWRFSTRRKKMKNATIYWPQGQWGGVRAHYCATVNSCAVKWSRKTKGKMTVDRLFTSRHQASFMLGLITSPCSWTWFKVLTSISWCRVCCPDMFHKDLSTATESAATLSAATLSTMREMMYFTRTKRRYFWFAQPPTPKSPRQDRFKVLPTLGTKWLDLFLWLPGGSNRSN